jgi:hypothetical protein
VNNGVDMCTNSFINNIIVIKKIIIMIMKFFLKWFLILKTIYHIEFI